jgi:uncharacterized OsmC-like protein
MNLENQASKKFIVNVKRTSKQLALAETHGQKLTLAIDGSDPSLGFTAPETVLAAFGACVLSNITKGAKQMNLQVEGANIEFSAYKRSNPLGFHDLKYVITILSPEPKEKLMELYGKATTDGTATNSLLEGLKPQGKLNVQKL